MEKFSAYRDPGTGIQPFLPPVPPVGADVLAKITLPIRYVLGLVRTLVVLLFLAIYIALVPALSLVLSPIPPLRRLVSHILTAIVARASLFLLGFFWVPVEQVKRKRGRAQARAESWNPRAGDIIVSNWVSWVELLWLAFRFNPIFVLPVAEAISASAPRDSSLITHTPGRRTGTGSANIQTPSKINAGPSVPIQNFRTVSLLSMIGLTGHIPPFGYSLSDGKPLEALRKTADRPIVVFPECTTSNGRGLLRFANIFRQNSPPKNHHIYVMCVRYDPPTPLSPTVSWSIPSTFLNPLPHLFTLASSLTLPSISIRLLVPSESPSSQLFVFSEFITETNFTDDQLTEVCAILIAQLGKMKRTGMRWEDKGGFLDFFRQKRT